MPLFYFLFYLSSYINNFSFIFFFQAEDGIRDRTVTGSSDVCSSDLERRGGRTARAISPATAAITAIRPTRSANPFAAPPAADRKATVKGTLAAAARVPRKTAARRGVRAGGGATTRR